MVGLLWARAVRAGAGRAMMAVLGGALLAFPWRLDVPAGFAIVAVLLALVPTVVLVTRHVDGEWPSGRGMAGADRSLAIGVAALLVGLVRPVASVVLLVAWFALAAGTRWRAYAAARAAAAQVAVPALIAWFALGGDRVADLGALSGLGWGTASISWLAANAVALWVVLGWTTVIGAMLADGNARRGRTLIVATAGWAAVITTLAAANSASAALTAIVIGLGIWSAHARPAPVPDMRGVDLALLGLVVTGACLNVLP